MECLCFRFTIRKRCQKSLDCLSQNISSKWADENLFFKHHRVEEDFLLRPEWEKWGKTLHNCPVTEMFT